MKKVFLFISIALFTIQSKAQINANWTNKQLMEPSELAGIINNHNDSVIIISVGPFSSIPGSLHVGVVSEQQGLDKFKAQLSSLNKNQKIVIYCGCCPFEHCPNVRPAIDVLKEMNFTNYYLLNLPNNLRINWIDKGYPTIKHK
jgi:rhodanese-related sulfurtransferase